MPYYELLICCLALAFAFEFVNGFHDTANAVATVIYTRTLPSTAAVILSGICNFLGVMLAGTAVAWGIIKLLPPDVLAQSPVEAPLSIVIAALISSVSWNLFTWYLGIPASSSHTLIGAILGVGLAHSTLPGNSFGSGVNWSKAQDVGLSLLISPIVGFILAHLLFKFLDRFIKDREAKVPVPEGQKPKLGIRLTLISTCMGVSFAHGCNDGQKGVGLVLLILMAFYPGQYTEAPSWVIVFVALALGIGTTIGWKRIVITVGEKIGKSHLTPLQGAAAELTAAGTIMASSMLGLPVSTTQVLSSGIAGTMFAAGTGVQRATTQKILLAWILTLPVSMLLSVILFYILRWSFGLH